MTDTATPEFLTLTPVIPVVTFADAGMACEVAQALLRGGVGVIEVTLRNEQGLKAIASIARNVPQMTNRRGHGALGRRTCALPPMQARLCGLTGFHARACWRRRRRSRIPYLPAVSTASELMVALEAGYRHLKFFPAAVAGGMELLRALESPFPQARFCATGGITAETARTYLQLSNVLCVGGSWLTPADALARRDWARIEMLAAQTAALRPRRRPRPVAGQNRNDGDPARPRFRDARTSARESGASSTGTLPRQR